jgi:D-serine dehydratase
MIWDQEKYSSNVSNGRQINTNDSTICSFFLQSEEITTTFYGYELQLSKIYTRCVYNRFKETYKSSTTFGIHEDTTRNGYYFVEHRVVQIEFPRL